MHVCCCVQTLLNPLLPPPLHPLLPTPLHPLLPTTLHPYSPPPCTPYSPPPHHHHHLLPCRRDTACRKVNGPAGKVDLVKTWIVCTGTDHVLHLTEGWRDDIPKGAGQTVSFDGGPADDRQLMVKHLTVAVQHHVLHNLQHLHLTRQVSASRSTPMLLLASSYAPGRGC